MKDEKDRVRELAELTSALVRIPSANPPGREEEIASFVQSLLREQGLDPAYLPLEPSRGSVVAKIEGRRPGQVVLCGHLDTVGLKGEWSFPPLSGEIRDGRVWGRGAADMKGGVAVIVAAFLEAAARGEQPKLGLTLLLTADEEGNYRGAKTARERGHLDGSELVVIAEPSDGTVYLGQKGELWLKAIIRGIGTHGSVPELGVNAALAGCEFARLVIEEVRKLPPTDLGKTSINLGRIAGGWQVNVVPERCEVELDVRPVNPDQRDAVLRIVNDAGAAVSSRLGAGFELAVTNDRAPMEISPQLDLIKRFLAAAERATGTRPATALAPYSTDAVEIYPQLGVPFVIYGPGSIAQAHRPDEYVEIEELARAFSVISAFLEDVLFKGDAGAVRSPAG